MRAVLYTGGRPAWSEVLGEHPWALLPIAGRPLLSYWLELCIDLGIRDVQIILGHDAEYIELFCGNGEKWGLNISYSFLREDEDPRVYLSRDPGRWQDGLLFIGKALFPRRQEGASRETLQGLLEGCCVTHEGRSAFFASNQKERVDTFIQTGSCPGKGDRENCCVGGQDCIAPSEAGLDCTFIKDIGHYYRLNMDVVRGEMGRYLSGGYSSVKGEEASVGYNVITPLSVALTPPLAIGNNCRIGALASIGPNTVISDHVLIDRQCELSDCIILSNTYVGRNLEIKEKIVAGNRIIDPEDGTYLDIEDPWLVAQTRSSNYLRDFARAVFSWEVALLMVLVQIIPFVLFYGLIRLFQRGGFVRRNYRGIGGKPVAILDFAVTASSPCFLLMLFQGLSLDRFPQLVAVLSGKLWLCGQVPRSADIEIKDSRRYFPAVFSYADAFVEIDHQMDALYYAHTRSVVADLRILRHALFARLMGAGLGAGSPEKPASMA